MSDLQVKEMEARLPDSQVQALDQLAAMMNAYNEVTDRLNQSHTRLQAEVRRLRGELKKKNELLEQKSRLAALGEMAAGMAHEIRNPLGAVQLYASLMEKDLQHNEPLLACARKIIRAVSSLDTIVNDMLTYTQDLVCSRIEVLFWGLLEEALDLVRPRLKGEALVIDTDGVDRKLVINADISMMSRVMMNLVLNAVEALEGKGTVRISALACEDRQYRVRIGVDDDGPGIARGAIKKIFDPFYTTKDAGTGLGLAIVHRLIDCHNGVITAANRTGGGAEFTILLP